MKSGTNIQGPHKLSFNNFGDPDLFIEHNHQVKISIRALFTVIL